MITLVGKEWGDPCSGTQGIVISKFYKQEQGVSVVLLIIAKYLQVLFQGLIGPFGLSVEMNALSLTQENIINLHKSKDVQKYTNPKIQLSTHLF